MKKTLLFLMSLQWGILASAQTIVYQPLYGNYTNYGYHGQGWNGSIPIDAYYKTVWGRDTLINGENYTQIYQDAAYVGGIREDVANQQRYFLNLNNVEKNISISPFLSAGDLLSDSSVFLNAFRTYFNEENAYHMFDTLVVGHVDSILEADGNYSATYSFETPTNAHTFFVFNTYRGLLNIDQLEFHVNQFCYRELNSGSPATGEIICDLGINENKTLQVELFPNPAAESITLSGEDLPSIENMAIYDLQGNLIKQLSLSEMGTEISLKELKSGVYFLALNQNSKVLRFQKV